MHTAKLFIELTPMFEDEPWGSGAPDNFIDCINDDGLYRATEATIDTEDPTRLLARLERDFGSLKHEGYNEDYDEHFSEKINHKWFEDNLGDDIENASFNCGDCKILELEIVEVTEEAKEEDQDVVNEPPK